MVSNGITFARFLQQCKSCGVECNNYSGSMALDPRWMLGVARNRMNDQFTGIVDNHYAGVDQFSLRFSSGGGRSSTRELPPVVRTETTAYVVFRQHHSTTHDLWAQMNTRRPLLRCHQRTSAISVGLLSGPHSPLRRNAFVRSRPTQAISSIATVLITRRDTTSEGSRTRGIFAGPTERQ